MAITWRAQASIGILLLSLAFELVEAQLQDGDASYDYDADDMSIIPSSDEKVFNVLHFGAKSDGKTNNVEHFKDAWRAACGYNGQARFVIPSGVFLTSHAVFGGPCRATMPMVVQISGVVKAFPNIHLYPTPEWLVFEDHDGLVIFGGGTIDGQGHYHWHHNDCKHNPNCTRLPSSMVINKVTNAWIWRINSVNPMGFHFFISGSKNIRMVRLMMEAPNTSPNTDGVHISGSDNVKVTRTTIKTGDDCVGILQGSTRISLNKLHCGPGHGISIGSLGKYHDEEDVIGIRVKNCTLAGTENGLRIKTYQFKPDVVPIRAAGFSFKNIVMDNVKNPIIINQEYCGSTSHCKGRPSKIRISDIYFRNIMGTSSTTEAIKVVCSSAMPCRNVHFHNVMLTGLGGQHVTATCSNAKIALSGHQLPPIKCQI